MTREQRVALAAAVLAVFALLYGYGTGALDDALRTAGLMPDAPPAGEAADPAAVAGSSAVPAAPVAPDQKPARTVVPVFDLVRVEPTGDAVIAGQGVPEATVEILSGAVVIATGTANAAGEWAIVLSDPLKAGAHDLRVRSVTPAGGTLESEQSVAVSVPEGGNGEVLVVLNEPGSASTVLQVPGLDEAREKLREAGVAPSTLEPVEEAAAAAGEPDAAGKAPETPVATAPPAAGSGSSGPTSETPVAAAPSAPAAPAGETPVAAAPPAASAAPSAAPPGTTAGDPVASSTAGAGSEIAASLPPATIDSPAAAPSGGETVVEGQPATAGETAIAMTAPPPSTPSPAAEPAPAVVPAAPPPAASAPQPAPDTAAAPAPEPPAATPPAAEPAATAPPAPAAAEPAAPAAPAPAPVVTIEAVETEAGTLYAAGSAAVGATVRLYVDGEPVADAAADENARWLVEAARTLAPGDHTVRVDQVAPDGTVLARSEVVFQQAEDPMEIAGGGSSLAVAGSGSAGEARVGSTKTIIIRRGDNLWRIARRLYGLGVRYSTIYEANADQIRNPGLIYPGQVFVLPEGDAAWTAAVPPPVATP